MALDSKSVSALRGNSSAAARNAASSWSNCHGAFIFFRTERYARPQLQQVIRFPKSGRAIATGRYVSSLSLSEFNPPLCGS